MKHSRVQNVSYDLFCFHLLNACRTLCGKFHKTYYIIVKIRIANSRKYMNLNIYKFRVTDFVFAQIVLSIIK